MHELAASHIIDIAKRLNQKNFLASADGNISFRLSDGTILITPSGRNKAFIHEDELAIVTLDNKILKGTPSGERLMHLEVYNRCPKARAIVHAHPPYAIAWSIAHPELTELPKECLSELILATGGVPIAPYARPGTQDMGSVLAPYLPQHRVMILSRHGALAWGEDLDEAYNGMERLEHTALILSIAKSLGGLTQLPDSEVTALLKMRQHIGERIL